MSYAAAIDHLNALGLELAPPAPGPGLDPAAQPTRRKFDLAHMRTLAAALGDPQKTFPSVLIAGTNGKGSTAATLASILAAAGYRTALYTSPHLLRVNERIQITAPLNPTEYAAAPDSAGPGTLHPIDDETFARLYFHVDEAARNLVHSGDLPHPPSFFEVLTALAFCHFAERKVDIAILEVGLGGRLDATNIVEPILSILTDIALDHMDYLGNTIAEITREKAGILRLNGTLITLPQHPEANQAIGEAAATLNLRAISAADFTPPTTPGFALATPSTPTSALAIPSTPPPTSPIAIPSTPSPTSVIATSPPTSVISTGAAQPHRAAERRDPCISSIERTSSDPGTRQDPYIVSMERTSPNLGTRQDPCISSIERTNSTPPPNQPPAVRVAPVHAAPHNSYTLTVEGAPLLVDSPLPGQHQQRNIALAIAAAVELRNTNKNKSNPSSHQTSYNISNESIEAGIRNTDWPGRLELLANQAPQILLDVAHNPAGVWTLRAAIAQLPEDRPRTLIFSCLRDKNLTEMARILLPLFDSASDGNRPHDHVIFAPIDSPRATSVEDLLAAAHALGIPAHAAPHVAGALAQARRITPPNGLILATGSVYLIGELRHLALNP